MSLSHPLRTLAALAAVVLSGCVSIEKLAPPVTPAMAGSGGASVHELEAGRRIYVGRCASCHSIDPVAKYTAARWRGIVLDMADEAELSAGEEASLLDYLLAARTVVSNRE
jgi:hypothetical protein